MQPFTKKYFYLTPIMFTSHIFIIKRYLGFLLSIVKDFTFAAIKTL